MDADLSHAVTAVAGALDAGAISPSSYPYSGQIGTDVYPGLGDTDWADVAKAFAGEIGKGIGGKISGKNPYVTTAAAPIAALRSTSTTTLVVIGGAMFVGGLLLIKALK